MQFQSRVKCGIECRINVDGHPITGQTAEAEIVHILSRTDGAPTGRCRVKQLRNHRIGHQRQFSSRRETAITEPFEGRIRIVGRHTKSPDERIATYSVCVAVQRIPNRICQRRCHRQPIVARQQRTVRNGETQLATGMCHIQQHHNVICSIEQPVRSRRSQIKAVERIVGLRIKRVDQTVTIRVDTRCRDLDHCRMQTCHSGIKPPTIIHPLTSG